MNHSFLFRRIQVVRFFIAAGLIAGSLLPARAAASPAFVQERDAQINSGTSNRVAFARSNTAGNLLVAYVIWDNTGAVSISDSRGNTYVSAVGPTRFNGATNSAQVFYARNVAAGANTVTAAFATSVRSFGILYVHEYSGIDPVNPVDAAAAAAGSSGSLNSGLLPTGNATDLLFGAGLSSSNVTTAGSGYTVRSTGNGNMTMDRNVTTTGSYNATASHNGTFWAMQLVAFRAAGGTPVDTTPPTVPTNVKATAVSTSQINLSWTASTDPDSPVAGYRIFRNGVQTASVTSGTSFQDTGLTPNTSYSYAVSAYDAAGNNSAQSTGASATTLPLPVPVISLFTATPTSIISGQASILAWTVSNSTSLTLDNGLGTVTGTTARTVTPVSTTTYTLTATNSAGSVTAQTTVTVAADTQAPTVPANLSATASSTSQINLSWTASTDNVVVTGYRIYRNASPLTTTTATSYGDAGLTTGTSYTYNVVAYDAAANVSALSSPATATTLSADATPPTVPTNLQSSNLTSSSVTVSWTASTDPDSAVAGYRMYRNGGLLGSVSQTSYGDSGLSPSTTYAYTVAAYDPSNNLSAPSQPLNVTTTTGPAYPVKASANNRYLVDQNNVPFLINGEAPHSLIANLSTADADYYFANRQAAGINAAWIQLLCVPYTGGRTDGSTYDGLLPFTRAWDLSTPNEAYFARVDAMIQLAANHGVVVFLDPVDTGGLTTTLRTNGVTIDRAFGQYIGNRYKSFDNIVWMNGNDFQTWTDPADEAVVQAIALGIQDTDTRHIQTVELDYPVSGSLDDNAWAPIIQLDGAYTYYSTYAQVLTEYNRPSFKPVFMMEAHYEFENLWGDLGTASVLRRQEYWSNLSGAAGQLSGNGRTWPFQTGWKDNLDSPGSNQMRYVKALFESHRWYDLVPDQNHSVVTAGYGTFSDIGTVSTDTYATAGRTPDGALVMAYMPTLRTLTVDMAQLYGLATARWYDPTSGTYTTIAGSPLANVGLQQFTPPGNNSGGDGDWVLLLEVTGPIIPDTQAPSVPTSLTATAASSSQINLSWTASTDNVGVTGYKVFRNGVQVGTPVLPAFSDSGLSSSTPYTYTVSAFDFAGNQSSPSNSASATTIGSSSAPSGAIAAYTFDEGLGTIANDSSGNLNTGKLINGAGWTTGEYGQAILFNGDNNFVDIGNGPTVRLTGSMTITAWINSRVFPRDDAAVASKRDGSDRGYQLDTTVDTGRRTLGFKLSNSSGVNMARYGNTTLQLNRWYHIAAVYDAAAQTMSVYLNGQLDNGTLVGTVASSQQDSSLNVTIGRRSGLAGFEFSGTIDNLRIYNRALSPSEIQADLSTPVGQ